MERLLEFLLYTFFIVIILIIIHSHDYLKLFLVCLGFSEACILAQAQEHLSREDAIDVIMPMLTSEKTILVICRVWDEGSKFLSP